MAIRELQNYNWSEKNVQAVLTLVSVYDIADLTAVSRLLRQTEWIKIVLTRKCPLNNFNDNYKSHFLESTVFNCY